MISIIIPTYNREYVLSETLYSYYLHKNVNEIIIVDDCSDDKYDELIEKFQLNYPSVRTIYTRNNSKNGASKSKLKGAQKATNKLIMFGEDDVILESDYVEKLFSIFNSNKNVAIASGRIIYKRPLENIAEAKDRFVKSFRNIQVFDKINFSINYNVYLENNVFLPFSHALFLTERKLFLKMCGDSAYTFQNQYREETHFQINAFLNGYKHLLVKDSYCFHLSRQEVYRGGQNRNRFQVFLGNIYNTNLFFNQFYQDLRPKLNLIYTKDIALILYILLQIYKIFLYPFRKIFIILQFKLKEKMI